MSDGTTVADMERAIEKAAEMIGVHKRRVTLLYTWFDAYWDGSAAGYGWNLKATKPSDDKRRIDEPYTAVGLTLSEVLDDLQRTIDRKRARSALTRY